MAEIKSTLDLVMEKTKHLSLSKKEKEEQKLNELKKNIRGVLKKYEDGVLKKRQVKEELNALKTIYNVKIEKVLQSEIMEKFTLEHTNSPLLVLLKDLCGVDTARLETIMGDYQGAAASAASKRAEEIKADLVEKRRISGSAVVANLKEDITWNKKLNKIQATYNQLLEQEKTEHLSCLSVP